MATEMKFDSVYANVPDLESSLEKLQSTLGLRPFLRFDLVEIRGEATPGPVQGQADQQLK